MQLVVVASDGLDDDARLALRGLWERAFGDRFTDDDADHAYGGVHVLALDGGRPVAHAAAVPRRLQVGDGPWREAGYVEAVAVEPERQGTGLGREVMGLLAEQVRRTWPLAVLSTGRATGFYAALGWALAGESWTGDRPDTGHGGLMVLRVDPAAAPDLATRLTCEQRSGSSW